ASVDALKQTILQLAVMGKLVPQDPNDEPASELLKRIAQEKAQLVKEGTIKKQKPLPPISDEDKPFELPDGWEWTNLPNLSANFQNGLSSRGSNVGEDTIVIRLADIQNWRISYEDTRALKITKEMKEKYSMSVNDILIIRVNGSSDIVGRFILNKEQQQSCFCDHFIKMNFLCKNAIDCEYLTIISGSPLIRKKIENLFITTAGQKTVNQTHISSLAIPLPPIKEQIKIVKKINELFGLIEALKASIKTAQQTQLHLADALTDAAIS
ncbi:TPA: restriction endonuclease subunit S, partial [Escherichia coli]